MNFRKQQVIKKSHQLFIERGFQETSIQDILDFSGISKGTFYNYFSSKNELLISVFKDIYLKMENERNQLIIGEDPSDIEIFIRQFELLMITNKKNKLSTLFEEVMISADQELKHFIKIGQFRNIKWTYQRFIQIFGEDKNQFLFDCAIMFHGMLHHNMKFYALDRKQNAEVQQVVRYTVRRIVNMVHELAASGEQLNKPELMDKWLPDQENSNQLLKEKLNNCINNIKASLSDIEDKQKYIELLDFILDELLYSKKPRELIVLHALTPLENAKTIKNQDEVQNLKQIITSFYNKVGSSS